MAEIGVSFRTEQSDVDKLDEIAHYIFRQRRAGALRLILLEVIEKYSDQVAAAKLKAAQKQSIPAITSTPVSDTSDEPVHKSEPSVIQADYTSTDNWGAPKACPVCNAEKSSDGLEQPALAVVKSGKDWGAWACHECYSSGRWYDAQPFIILEDTRRAEELPLSQNTD